MNEEETVKKALKDAYMNEIIENWISMGKIKKDDVAREPNKPITFPANVDFAELVNDVANKLAETKTDFWWKTHVQKQLKEGFDLIQKAVKTE